ncbi:hypothetical protein Tco_0377587 [Tanacetum coccineum]
MEFEIECLLRVVVSQDIICIVQSNSVVDTSNLQTELDQCKYDKISYDKAYNDMQQKFKRFQAQLGDLKVKSKDTPCESDTLDPLSQKLENENVELEFRVLNYEKENAHLKTTYKNLFDSIKVTRAQTKTIIDSLKDKLHDTICENAKLRAQLFDKVSEQKDTTKGTSVNTQFCKQSILGKPSSSSGSKLHSVTPLPKSKGLPKIDESHALSKPVTSNSVPTPQESKVMKNDNVIAPGMFKINPFQTSREEKSVPNKPIKASVKTNPITVSQPHVITKKHVNYDSNGLSSTRVDNTAKTRRPQPRSNTKNDRVPSASKSSCIKDKEKHKPAVKKPRKVDSRERLASPTPSEPSICCRSRNRSLLNDHVAAILGYGDLQWGKYLIHQIYSLGLGAQPVSLGQKLDISFLYVFEALCYPKNDREDIGKLGAKGLDLPYASSTITSQKPTEGELDLPFEAMYDDHIGGQPSAAPRTVPASQAPQVLQTPTATTTTTDTASTPTNSSSQAISIPSTSQNVDELETQQQHVQHQPATIADNVLNAMFGDNLFVNPFATPSTSDAESSSSQYVDPSNMHTFYQPYPHEYQWTKDHPLEQVIGEPS